MILLINYFFFAKLSSMSEDYQIGQKVDLIIIRETPLGFIAKVNAVREGLLYHNEIFEHLEPGDQLPGYIKFIREDGGLDLIIQPLGHHGALEIGSYILEALNKNQGFLAINNTTSAEEIYSLFGVSKKKYKMALGGLYKKRIIKITDEGIYLINKNSKTP